MADSTLNEIKYQDSLVLIADELEPGSETNVLFYEDDQWQDGDGWVGPQLNNTHPLYQETTVAIQRSFVSQNVIKEVSNRETMAAVGDIPYLSFVLRREVSPESPATPEERLMLSEAKNLFDEWFQKQQVHELLKQTAIMAALTSTSSMRFFIPPVKLEGGGVPRIDPTEIKDYLFVESLSPFNATVYQDPVTKERIGLYAYDYEDREAKQTKKYIEKVWIEEGLTNLRIEDQYGATVDGDYSFELNGLLPMFTMKRPILITGSVRSNQKALNNCLTMMSRNTTQGGFLERIFLNAQMPGYVENEGTAEERFVPEGLNVGPGATSFMAGIVTVDSEGNERVTNPQVYYHDPTESEVFLTAKDGFYQAILMECQQSHVEMNSQPRVSGESRRQSRSEFANQAAIPAGQIVIMMEWLAETFFSFTDLFSNTGYFEKIRPVVTIELDIGPLPAEETAELINTYEAGMVSIETAMARLNIKDIDTEKNQIASQDYQSADLQSKRAATMLSLKNAGIEASLAAKMAGFSNQVVVELQSQDALAVEPTEPVVNETTETDPVMDGSEEEV